MLELGSSALSSELPRGGFWTDGEDVFLDLGPDELLVAAKLEFDQHLTIRELAAAIDETEAQVRQAVPMARVIYLEPDVHRDGSV